MAFKILGSAEPKYLAASDILIGDMSNINYEFLLFNRPIILLANQWVRKYFPDIGIKTTIDTLQNSIEFCINNPEKYSLERKKWLEKTIDNPFEKNASQRYIDIMLQKSKYQKPTFIFIDGNDPVRKTNLTPLVNECVTRTLPYLSIRSIDEFTERTTQCIYVAAHFQDITKCKKGYAVHIDHDLKGIASANIYQAILDYKKNSYFPNIDLHITAGIAGDARTKFVLGPYANRTIIGGYPKADDFIHCNTKSNKDAVYDELGLKKGVPLITYAPAGNKNYMKPGGSLNKNVLKKLKTIAMHSNYHILAKLKYDSHTKHTVNLKSFVLTCFDKYKCTVTRDCGKYWLQLKV